MEGVHVRSVGCDRHRDPHVSAPRSWGLLGLVALLACVSSCRDNPAGLAITPGPEAPGASDNSLALIAQLVDSAFLRPLLQRATAPGTADQLAAALAALSNSPTQDEIRTAATVLSRARGELAQSAPPVGSAADGVRPSVTADESVDPELAIIQDFLAVVLASAIDALPL